MLLSTEDLKMMMDEVSEKQVSRVSLDAGKNPKDLGTVNLETFLLIMENSPW